SSDNIGYIGMPGYRMHWIQSNYLRYDNIHQTSSRKNKTDIKDLNLKEINEIFDEIELKSFRYLESTDKPVEFKKGKTAYSQSELVQEPSKEISLGIIAEEAPDIITCDNKQVLNVGNYINVIAGS